MVSSTNIYPPKISSISATKLIDIFTDDKKVKKHAKKKKPPPPVKDEGNNLNSSIQSRPLSKSTTTVQKADVSQVPSFRLPFPGMAPSKQADDIPAEDDEDRKDVSPDPEPDYVKFYIFTKLIPF